MRRDQSPVWHATVYVCTRGYSESLIRCLRSLTNQKLPGGWESYQICVCFGADDSEGYEQLRTGLKKIPFFANPGFIESGRIINSGSGGIPAARNRCLRDGLERKSDAVVFIDDDCVATDGWLYGLLEHLHLENVDAAAGLWMFSPTSAPSGWIPRSLWNIKSYHTSSMDEYGNIFTDIASTRSVALKTESLRSAGGLFFDETRAASGGSDSWFFSSWRARGLSILICWPSLVIEIFGSRRTQFPWHLERAWRNGLIHGNAVRSKRTLPLSAPPDTGVVNSLGRKNWLRSVLGGLILGLTRSSAVILGLAGFSYSYYAQKPVARSETD